MLIPAIDLIDGQVVRLKQGDFAQKTVFEFDPVEQVCAYAQDGAQLIHIVDLDGAKDPQKRQLPLIERIAKASCAPIQTGGGIRSREDIASLLKINVERVVVGSAAVADVAFGKSLIEEFSPEHICLALDVRIENGKNLVATHGWLQTSNLCLEEVIEEFLQVGLKHVLVTDISKDGMMKGPNAQLYERLAQQYSELDIIASGGISCLDDLRTLRDAHVPSCVLGRALLSGAFTFKEALACWPNA